MYTKEEILNYHCPRWNEWPEIDLYMDQVVSLLEKNVSRFYTESDTKPVTSTMINNYVKLKIIIPSNKKRYQREHLADLYIVFLMKSVLNMSDICATLTILHRLPSFEAAYNQYCEEIESALALAFNDPNHALLKPSEQHRAINSIALAFAYTLLARCQMAADYPENKTK